MGAGWPQCAHGLTPSKSVMNKDETRPQGHAVGIDRGMDRLVAGEESKGTKKTARTFELFVPGGQ